MSLSRHASERGCHAAATAGGRGSRRIARVIDELMGHASGHRDRGVAGSPMGQVYRETTPAMVARVTAALDDRIGHAMAVAAYLLREGRDWRAVDSGEGL